MSKPKSPSPYARFAALSNAQKRAVVAEFDALDVVAAARPLSPAMQKLWKKAKNKGGRPRVGRGAKRVLLSIEQGLLEQADELARRRKLTRSELFSRGVRTMLARAG